MVLADVIGGENGLSAPEWCLLMVIGGKTSLSAPEWVLDARIGRAHDGCDCSDVTLRVWFYKNFEAAATARVSQSSFSGWPA